MSSVSKSIVQAWKTLIDQNTPLSDSEKKDLPFLYTLRSDVSNQMSLSAVSSDYYINDGFSPIIRPIQELKKEESELSEEDKERFVIF